MSERTVFNCDGCGVTITTPQPAVTLFVDQRFAKSMKGGNYHCCSVLCLIAFGDKLRDVDGINPNPPPRGDTGGIR